jgi:plasmid stability protein
MGTITIRRLDDEVIDRLKERAARNGRSMEEEARVVITQAADRRLRGQEAVEYFRKLQEDAFGDRVLPDSVDVFREMREADPTKWDGE